MSNEYKIPISPTRLRLGVLLIFIWWLPIWLIAPQIADLFGADSNNARIVIIVVQTIIGFLGLLVAGQQIASIMKGTPFKKMIPMVWKVLRSGSING